MIRKILRKGDMIKEAKKALAIEPNILNIFGTIIETSLY